MPTKAELENQILDLKHEIRRQQRSINQLKLDLDELPLNAFKSSFTTPHLSEQT